MVAKTISAEDECQKGDTAKALIFSDKPELMTFKLPP